MIGTAPPAQTFLAVEMPGPWGANAIRESRASSPALVSTARRVASSGGRMVVVRRFDRRSASRGHLRWFWADCRPGKEALRTGLSPDYDDLLRLRLDGSDGDSESEPLWLCCTHSKHDRCCAEEGRVVFRDLEDMTPGRVWESSHLGGCRFAGNVVVLPHGLYYGRVSTADVPALVAAHARGEVVREHLRGRSSLASPAQAASRLVSDRLGVTSLAAIEVGDPSPADGGRWSVPLRVDGSSMVAVVRLFGTGQPVGLTCGAEDDDRPPAWSLDELRHGEQQ